MILKHKIILIGIICFAYVLRVYGINWDQGYNLHPDERAIVMFTLDIHLPSSLSDFLSPTSPLNPHFFAYGNFPLYLLKLVSTAASIFDSSFATYDRMALVGRVISTIADIGTLLVLFLISRKLFNPLVGIFAATTYALSVFPIQASHFYAVDILLTFFCMLTLYATLLLAENKEKKYAVFTGLSFGFALATKISALVLGISITVLVLFACVPAYKKFRKTHSIKSLKDLAMIFGIIALSTVTTFVVTQPYALIDWRTFLDQTLQQSSMTHDVFTFPYTMQYYGKIPYIYELKNIFFWGLGPIISLLSCAGIFYFVRNSHKNRFHMIQTVILGSFLIVYFLIVGNFAVGWMRYMLPLYPFLALFAGIAIYNIILKISKYRVRYIIGSLILAIGISYWPMSFIQIYSKQHPRVEASDWIISHIPSGSIIATEHWDDRLPLSQSEMYTFNELPLYDTDTPIKWESINSQLETTEYILLSSNRLYTPLQKLTDCTVLPPGKCYPYTAQYYQELFSGRRGYRKVAEFTNFPTVPILNIQINDQSADESFTVYDHPKVVIFRKIDN